MSVINILLVVSICINLTISQQDSCTVKETCSACLQEFGCAWCNAPFDKNENMALHRCAKILNNDLSNWCQGYEIINSKSSMKILQNLQLQTSSEGKAVQISPQRVKLTLRRGEEFEIKFKYAQAEDYPVDLYYIMDLSWSMDKHRDKLSKLGAKLAETMRNLTKNFRLGFGSFVDKTDMPFTSTVEKYLKSPCTLKNGNPCAPPYSFINHLPLTEETEKFTEQVESAVVSGNIDFPEGGLDALMQAIVCEKEIGWREKARHLIILSTDAGYHIAGDGKLAGIVLPNDGQCHLKNNKYTHELLMDYPSIGQINRKAIENNINVIFAVEFKQKIPYTVLKDQIKEASIGILSEDSSNVVDLVKNVYSKIVDSVKISDNSDSNIEVKYYSSCREKEEKETNECRNLKIGVQVDFRAVIKVVNCPDNKNKTQIFQIKPGALNETLTVEVEMICGCECEKQGIKNAAECFNSGTLQCGICSCDYGKYGKNCECDDKNNKFIDDLSGCRSDNVICSNFGTCKCGKCDCAKRTNANEVIYGKFCECNNYSCKRKSGLLCSGPDHGRCDCGKCICLAGWGGDTCDCPDNNNTCIASDSNGEICSGHGFCKCGQCECDLVDGYRYSGKYCEECPTCEGKLCDDLRHCVECRSFEIGIYNKKECAKHCSTHNIKMIDSIEQMKFDDEKVCSARDRNNCYFYYKYSYDMTNTIQIFVQRSKVCVAQVDILALMLGIIGSIILAGIILLLLWKGVTTIHDRREYAKFEQERKNAKWNTGENPFYKKPIINFQNPTYNNQNN